MQGSVETLPPTSPAPTPAPAPAPPPAATVAQQSAAISVPGGGALAAYNPPSASRKGRAGRGGWSIPFLCAGLATVACCILIPQIEENRQTMYECAKLRVDLAQLETQVSVNDQFVKRLSTDPAVAERLAQRQMRFIREGTSVLELNGKRSLEASSPYQLVSVPPPLPVPDYQPPKSKLARLCLNPRSRLYLTGGGVMLTAFGLILGAGGKRD